MTVTRCDFFDNRANVTSSNLGGGGAFFAANPQFTAILTDCRFRDNRADAGGGLFIAGVNATLTDCDFFTNVADGRVELQGGGGVYMNVNGTVTLTRCNFNLNTAMDGGGAYVCQSADAKFTQCRFTENKANIPPALPQFTSDGGGIWSRSDGDPTQPAGFLELINTFFLRNEATNNGGGVYFEADDAEGEDPVFTLCSFNKNTAGDSGGGIFYMDDGGTTFEVDPQVAGCILWDNSVDDIANCDFVPAPGEPCTDESAQIHNGGTGIGAAVFNRNCIMSFSGAGIDGNINDDPTLIDPEGCDSDPTNDFYLREGSPCIDAADATLLPQNVLHDVSQPINLRRIDDAATTNTGLPVATRWVDMGAFESLAPPYVLLDGQPDVPFMLSAYTGYIDPRAESDNGVSLNQGLDKLVVAFSEDVFKVGGGAIDASSFSVAWTGFSLSSSVGSRFTEFA